MTQRQAALAVDLLMAAIVASIGVALAGLTWRLAGEPGGEAPPLLAPSAPRGAGPVDIARIAASGLFGSAAPVAASATATDLQLRAILFARPAAASAVMVSASGGPAKAYAIGATLPNGAVVDAIERDRVLLRTGNGPQMLAFPSAAPAIANASGAAGDAAAIRALIPQAAQGAGIAPPPAAQPPALLQRLGAEPTANGYRVGPGAAPQLLAAGLRPGDVIERVNGTALGSPQGDRAVLDAAMAAGSAQIDIVRGGKRVTLTAALR